MLYSCLSLLCSQPFSSTVIVSFFSPRARVASCNFKALSAYLSSSPNRDKLYEDTLLPALYKTGDAAPGEEHCTGTRASSMSSSFSSSNSSSTDADCNWQTSPRHWGQCGDPVSWNTCSVQNSLLTHAPLLFHFSQIYLHVPKNVRCKYWMQE